jgi:integrase
MMSVTKRGKSWEVRYRDSQGVHRSKAFRTQASAKKYERAMTDALELGSWTNPDFGHLTVSQVNAEFMKSKSNLKPKSIAALESTWRCHIEPRFGKVKISKITVRDIHHWVTSSAMGEDASVSSGRIIKALTQLSQILDFAVDMQYLSKNPARKSDGTLSKISLPKTDKTRPVITLSTEELKRLSKECGEYQSLILLSGTIGLRWAEIVGLQAQDLDLESGNLMVTRTLSEVNGYFHESTPKSGQTRVVSIPSFLIPKLKELVNGARDTDLVFRTKKGTPLLNSNFKRSVLNPAIKRAGVPRITFHDLRHTAATNAISKGANPVLVAGMLGHSDPSLTLRRYAHYLPADQKNLASLISDDFLVEKAISII